MEPISIAALAAFLAPFFTKAGETLATESVKLALEKRQDIKDGIVSLFKQDEIISLGLDHDNGMEDIKKLEAVNPELAGEVNQRIESSELLKMLLNVIKAQTGNNSLTITAKNIAAAGNVTIQNQNNTFS